MVVPPRSRCGKDFFANPSLIPERDAVAKRKHRGTSWNLVPHSRGDKQVFQTGVKGLGLRLDAAQAQIGTVVVDDAQPAPALLAQLFDAARVAVAEHHVNMRRTALGRAVEVNAGDLPARR